jgi:solute:Na+ symporter, SSS family
MKLATIDLLIILLYLIVTVAIGFIMKNRARQSQSDYLMGGKKMPWYMLGLSNASDMFDISGTMWMVTICFVYGVKSMWIVWLWPVFNQIFQMMYLSKWLRRSNASTGAEWLRTRFGTGRGSELSHVITVAFALIGCLGFLAYGFVGLGKFIELFLPWEAVAPYLPFSLTPQYVPHFYGLIFTLFAMFYAVIGGMQGIVWGDVVMYGIMTIASICIAVIAMNNLGGQTLNTPEGWANPFFGWHLGLDWSTINPEVSKKMADDGFSPWGAFFMMMLFKGVFASLAGSAPNYDMQKVLSTSSPEEASKMSGFVSVILLPVRYSMIMGFTVLAILYYDKLNLQSATGIDFERILPASIVQFTPPIVRGILLAGLMAAFMGTFAGTLNAAQSYFVNDVYLKYMNPNASLRRLINMNYIVGLSAVALSVVLGFFAQDVNALLQWITSALYGGYVAANVLKWHWWRFNANGFAWGMLAGIVVALIFPIAFPTILPLWLFPLLFVVSLSASIIGSLRSEPTDEAVLKSFYKSVRPWGLWQPIHDKVVAEDPDFQTDANAKLDMFNVLIGIVAQCCLTLLPMYFILSMSLPLGLVVAILAVCAFILKKTWWNKLQVPQEDPSVSEVEKPWKTIVDVRN